MYKYDIVLASDHAGFLLKNLIFLHLKSKHLFIKDLGVSNSSESVDYPEFANKVVNFISNKLTKFGLLICGTGIGMSIAANRKTNIRAALCTNIFMGELARAHNDANILVLGAKVVEHKIALSIVDKFLLTPFEGERHVKRLLKLDLHSTTIKNLL